MAFWYQIIIITTISIENLMICDDYFNGQSCLETFIFSVTTLL